MARVGTGEVYTVFWWEKLSLGILRGRWKNNIEMGFQEIGLVRKLDLFGSGKGCASYILAATNSIQFSLLLRCDVLDVTS